MVRKHLLSVKKKKRINKHLGYCNNRLKKGLRDGGGACYHIQITNNGYTVRKEQIQRNRATLKDRRFRLHPQRKPNCIMTEKNESLPVRYSICRH